jgi:hypothetical protein
MPVRARARAAAGLAAVALLLGCGSEPEPPAAAERGPERLAAALAAVEALPEPLRQELLKTCDKWGHLDRPCDGDQVRRDQLECWADKGERIYAWTVGRELRPRARYLRTLMEVNTCMELKRWRKVTPGPELTSRGE